MQNEDRIIGIFFSDPHFSLTPPPLRSLEKNWFAAMLRPLEEIKSIQKTHHCPLFCCGDIFDRWNSPPEIINWVMKNLPNIHCIAGQHDLPEHNYKQIERSAYHTLINALTIDHIEHRQCHLFANKDIVLEGFSFGKKCGHLSTKERRFRIALIHQYNWIPNASHDGLLTEAQHVGIHRKEFESFDFVFSGDNHIPFEYDLGKTLFVNCGSIIRRKTTDLKWQPSIWLLRKDGKVQRYKLDTSQDSYLETEEVTELEKNSYDNIDIGTLIKKLGRLGHDVLDVKETFERAFDKETKQRKTILQRAMEEK